MSIPLSSDCKNKLIPKLTLLSLLPDGTVDVDACCDEADGGVGEVRSTPVWANPVLVVNSYFFTILALVLVDLGVDVGVENPASKSPIFLVFAGDFGDCLYGDCGDVMRPIGE